MPDAGDADDSGDTAGPGPSRVGWELPELVASAVVIAVTAYATFSVAAAIAGPGVDFGPTGRQAVSQAITVATGWGNFFTAFVLLGALAVLWWQAELWAEAADDADDADDAEAAEAAGHARRVTRLTGWALAVATLCVAASLTAFVNVAFVQPRPGPSGLDWQLALQYAGGASATVLVAGAGAVVGIRARRRCTGILEEPLPAGSPSSGAAG